MDQLFSILCTELKDNIVTIEKLQEKLTTSSIHPKPICRNLEFIYDWKSFIFDKLSQPPLQYQSKYNSFLISTQLFDGKKCVVLRGKRLPQHTEMVPRAGIRINKENISFDPVGPAEYRIDTLKFDEILRGLYLYLSKLPFSERLPVTTSWDRLRDRLEGLPNRSRHFPLLKIEEFPKQQIEELRVPEYLEIEDGDIPELTGDKYPEVIDEGNFEDDICVGMDVCIYGEDKKNRPWVGRILQLLEDRRFLIHWFDRKTVRSKTFFAMTDSKGDPVISELENDTVMFWQFTENRTENSFSLSNWWLETIRREYESKDQ